MSPPSPSSAASSTHPCVSSSKESNGTTLPSPSSPLPKASKKQTIDQLRDGLSQMGLDTKGKKETLWRRLVSAIHRAALRDPPSDTEDDSDSPTPAPLAGHSNESPSPSRIKQHRVDQTYNSFLCFDVEATCRGGKEFDWPNEIIEFPVVLLRWTKPDPTGKRRLEKVDTFQSYVRPTWSPQLTEFCTSLTGITQEKVDASPTFPEMLKELEKWLDKWNLRADDGKGLKEALWVTDGPWDLRDFIPKQLHITPPDPMPTYLHGPYLNIKFAVQAVLSEIHHRKAYADEHPHDPPNHRALSPISTARISRGDKNGTVNVKKHAGPDFYFNIPGMLEALGLGVFEGRQHSGLDDATNVARILIALSERDVVIQANGRTQPPGSVKKYPWMGKPGEVKWDETMTSNRGATTTYTTPLLEANGSETNKQPEKSDVKAEVVAPQANEEETVGEVEAVQSGQTSERESGETVEDKLARLSLGQVVEKA